MGTTARIVTYLLGASVLAIALRVIAGPAFGLADTGSMYADAKLGGAWLNANAASVTMMASRAGIVHAD